MIELSIVILALACLGAAYRMFFGPTDADRAIGADLMLFGALGLVATLGVGYGRRFTFDILIVASIVGFLGALSLARALTRGIR